MIIGLTGPIASGKHLIADYFTRKGFSYYSLSHVIRDEARIRKTVNNKKELQRLGTELRKKHGSNYLAKKVLEKINSDKAKNAVVDSFRHVDEVKEFRKRKDFILIAIDAPLFKRFKWLMKRKEKHDPKTLEEFLESNAIDFGYEQQADQSVGKCMEKANFLVKNNSSKIAVKKQLNAIYNKLPFKK